MEGWKNFNFFELSVHFSGQMGANMEYLLGIDGGGTKTVVCVEGLTKEKETRQFFYFGAFNINGQGEKETKKTLDDIDRQLKENGYEVKNCKGIGIGTAGISNPVVATFLKEQFLKREYECPIFLYGDQETALSAVFESCYGMILIAGTGSICFGKTKGEEPVRAGGYGHIIDDVGSGYAIARDMLTAIVRAEDGRGEKTVLTSLVFDFLGIKEIKQLIQFLYKENRSKKEVANLAILIEEAIRLGDKVACSIEEKSVNDLYELWKAVHIQMPQEKNLALTGSVLVKNTRISTKLIEKIHQEQKEMNIVVSKEEAVLGALRLLKKDKKERKVLWEDERTIFSD